MPLVLSARCSRSFVMRLKPYPGDSDTRCLTRAQTCHVPAFESAASFAISAANTILLAHRGPALASLARSSSRDQVSGRPCPQRAACRVASRCCHRGIVIRPTRGSLPHLAVNSWRISARVVHSV